MEKRSEIKEYDLFIVGNGFDLGCKYKTSYADYLKSSKHNDSILFRCFENSYSNGYIVNDDWNGFENQLCQFLNFIKYLFTSKNVNREFASEVYDGYNEYIFTIDSLIKEDIDAYYSFLSLGVTFNKILSLKIKNGPIIRNYYDFINMNDCEGFYPIALVYYDHFNKIDAKNEIVEERILKKIDKELCKLEEALKSYIEEVTFGEALPCNFIKDLVNNYRFKNLLSFNYSRNAEKILNVSKDNTIHIHGDISSSIILGVEEKMFSNQLFSINSNYGRFFKRYRRIIKNCSFNINNTVLSSIDSSSEVGVYGHSLDLSDKSILEMVFKRKCKKYDIFCFGEIDVYKLKLTQLIGIDLFEELYFDGKIEFIKIPHE